MGHSIQFQSQPKGSHHFEYQELSSTGTNHQGNKVNVCQRELQSIKTNRQSRGFIREVKIFFRAVKKIAIITYYSVKYVGFGVKLTPVLFEAHIKTLGPVAAKFLQGSDIIDMAKSLGVNTQQKEEFEDVLRKFLDDNPPMSDHEAGEILKESFGTKYSIKNHLATGTIGSCFEVEADGTSFVAKLVSRHKEDEIATGLKTLKILTCFLPTWASRKIDDVIDPFAEECSLLKEQASLTIFKRALAEYPENDIVHFSGKQATVSFHIPAVTEQSNSANVLVMKNIEGGITLNQLQSDTEQGRSLRSKYFSSCFGRQPTSDKECQTLITQVHIKLKQKWRDLSSKNGLVHCDFHPGNLMLKFLPNGHIEAWIIDLGNSLILSDQEQKNISEMRDLIAKLMNSDLSSKKDFTKHPELRNLLSFLKRQLSTKEAKKFDQKSEKSLLENLGQEISAFVRHHQYSLRCNNLYQLLSSTDYDDWIEELTDPMECFGAICILTPQHGISLPAYFTRFAFAINRGGIPLNDEDVAPKPPPKT